ncbi:MAG: transporter [Proteobacteria bacterium]|nr:transporter [Pseudomonadota bacterium]
MMSMPALSRAALAILSLLPVPAFACASCGCTLSTDAAAGYSSQPGWRINLDYSYIDQDQLRHGNGSASPGQVIDNPVEPSAGGAEIEKRTINRYLDLSLTYRPNADWGFTLVLPWVSRNHTTYGNQSAPFTPAEIAPDQISGVALSGLGDVKLMASWQGFLPTHNLGIQFGLKLPTGRYGGQDGNGAIYGHPQMFQSGPATGSALDTSLQAGNGSTDFIVGAYWYQAVSQDFDAYVNGQFQAAITHNLDRAGGDFRPGNQLSLSAGLRYEANPTWVPQLQVNLLHKSRDQGALADTFDTAGTVAYLSPGITVSLRQNLQLYGFVQVPVYSRLQGYQLFPRWTATAGISAGF